jgi:hypothetical protein
MFEATVSGSARESGDPVACPDSAARCDSADLIDRLVMLRAEAARREAEMLALMAEFVEQRRREDAGGPGERFSEGFAVDELALAFVSTRHRVRQQLHLAAALNTELSATGGLLAAGRIDGYQAWVIHDMISRLVGDEHVAAVEADIVERAPELTGGQIRSRLAKLIAEREPDAFGRRHQVAMRDRRVSANAGDPGAGLDGMGSLWFSHAAVDIAAIDDRITRIARAHTHTDHDADDRSFDNVRADVARDILLGRNHCDGGPAAPAAADAPGEPGRNGGGPSVGDDSGQPDKPGPVVAPGGDSAEGTDVAPSTDAAAPGDPAASSDTAAPTGIAVGSSAQAAAGGGVGGAQVFVVVPVQTLMGIDDAPGQLLGYGPIPAAVARAVAAAPDSVWRRMLTDPAGNMVDLSTDTYRPGKVLDLAVTVRDGTSRFPRSNASAVGADFDHTISYPAGHTCYGNGGKFTRRDHRVKHAPGWAVTQPEPGHFTWTTPTGHTYNVGPADQPVGAWPAPWQLDPNPPDLDELMGHLARAPDYLDDSLLHELGIDPPDE